MALDRRKPAAWGVHPGEILKFEFLRPLHLSGYRLANEIGVKPQTISDIVLGKRGISADMAIRLAKFFETTEEFWMNLQASYELSAARQQNKAAVARIRPHRAA